MKMIRAIVRPEKADTVVEALAKEGFVALTKIDVVGRGNRKDLTLEVFTMMNYPRLC